MPKTCIQTARLPKEVCRRGHKIGPTYWEDWLDLRVGGKSSGFWVGRFGSFLKKTFQVMSYYHQFFRLQCSFALERGTTSLLEQRAPHHTVVPTVPGSSVPYVGIVPAQCLVCVIIKYSTVPYVGTVPRSYRYLVPSGSSCLFQSHWSMKGWTATKYPP